MLQGTNIVIPFPMRSNNIWFAPHAPNSSRRFVVADTNGPKYPSQYYWLWGSSDGISDWQPIKNTTGRTADRGTFWHDVFRKRWVFSIKGYRHEELLEFGRHRLYWETKDDDPFGDYAWNNTDPVLWAAADTLGETLQANPSNYLSSPVLFEHRWLTST